jgi:glycosyltransferase involved in cell wall biosynthesis
MRITIVNGFFLPVPPLGGGSTEKSWFHLGREFAARGHLVVSYSRQWRGFPPEETVDRVVHRRLRGYDHKRSLWQNLLCDFAWSWRVFRRVPEADIIVCNAVALPVWLGRLLPRAGKVVVMTGRMPKGQYRRYSHLARVLAPSSLVRDRVLAENPALAPLTRVTGYPINWSLLAQPQAVPHFLPARASDDEVTLGFAGRIHEEKGLMLLVDALKLVSEQSGLPPWRLILCGPSDVERGGSGAVFRGKLLSKLAAAGYSNRVHLLDPQFNERTLAAIYQRMEIFCYPSLAEQGETFGVAVAEAMAAGAVPVVSNLACFRDFVRDGENGVVFDHTAADATSRLARALEQLIRDTPRRRALAARAQADVRRYDFPVYAEALLADFAELAGAR